MSTSVTVTAKAGPGLTATAVLISNVTSFLVDTTEQVLTVFQGSTFQTFDLHGVTTFTVTISGSNYTVTVS